LDRKREIERRSGWLGRLLTVRVVSRLWQCPCGKRIRAGPGEKAQCCQGRELTIVSEVAKLPARANKAGR
jgi:hypothetical protein